MDPMLLWGFGLLALAVLLVALEVLVPSGGVIGVLSVAAAVASIVCFWRVDAWWGVTGLLLVLVLGPLAVGFAFKIWPNTPIGRRMILGGETEEQSAQSAHQRQQEHELRQALVGVRGDAVTDLRPVGMVRIEGERIEATAESGFIAAGSQVRVTAVEGNRIKVRHVV